MREMVKTGTRPKGGTKSKLSFLLFFWLHDRKDTFTIFWNQNLGILWKNREKEILTSGSVHHPNTGQNIQHINKNFFILLLH